MINLTNDQLATLGGMTMQFEELLGDKFDCMTASLNPFMQGNTPNVEVSFFNESNPKTYITFRRTYNVSSAGFQYDCNAADYKSGITREFFQFITSDKLTDEIDKKLRKVRKYIVYCVKNNSK